MATLLYFAFEQVLTQKSSLTLGPRSLGFLAFFAQARFGFEILSGIEAHRSNSATNIYSRLEI